MKLKPKFPHSFGRNNREERRLQGEMLKINGLPPLAKLRKLSNRRIKKAWGKYETGGRMGAAERRLVQSVIMYEDEY